MPSSFAVQSMGWLVVFMAITAIIVTLYPYQIHNLRIDHEREQPQKLKLPGRLMPGWDRTEYEYMNIRPMLTTNQDDPTRYFFIQSIRPGWGAFLRGAFYGVYVVLNSRRYLGFVWPTVQELFVPRLLAWNMSEVDERLLPVKGREGPLAEVGCVPLYPFDSGYHPDVQDLFSHHPGQWNPQEMHKIWDVMTSVKFGQKQNLSVVSTENFPEADTLYIPYYGGNATECLEIQSLEQFRITTQSTYSDEHSKQAHEYAYHNIYRPFRVPSELEFLFQFSAPTAELIERTISRTFFLLDFDDSTFETKLIDDSLGTWQREMRKFLSEGDAIGKRQYVKDLVTGITDNLPLGSLIHCKRLTLVGNLIDRISRLGGPFEVEFRRRFNFHLITTHFRMGDKTTHGSASHDSRMDLDEVPRCLAKIDELKDEMTLRARLIDRVSTQHMFLSDSLLARQLVFNLSGGDGIIVPQNIDFDLDHLHDINSGGQPSFYRTLLVEWMFLAMADGLALTRSGFGESASTVANTPTVICKCRAPLKSGACDWEAVSVKATQTVPSNVDTTRVTESPKVPTSGAVEPPNADKTKITEPPKIATSGAVESPNADTTKISEPPKIATSGAVESPNGDTTKITEPPSSGVVEPSNSGTT